jgi:hypothetical protein
LRAVEGSIIKRALRPFPPELETLGLDFSVLVELGNDVSHLRVPFVVCLCWFTLDGLRRNKIGCGSHVEYLNLLSDAIGFSLLSDAGVLFWILFFLVEKIGVLCGDSLERLYPVGD